MKINKELLNSYKEKISKSFKDLEIKFQSLLNKAKGSTSSKKIEATSTDINDPKVVAQKRKTQVIRFVLIGVILFFIIDMFIQKSSSPKPITSQQGIKQSATPKTNKEIDKEAIDLQKKFDESMALELQKKQEEFKDEQESVDKELEQAKIEAKQVVDEVLAKQEAKPNMAEAEESNEEQLVEPELPESVETEPTPTPFETAEVLKTEENKSAPETSSEEAEESIVEESTDSTNTPEIEEVTKVETTKVEDDLPEATSVQAPEAPVETDNKPMESETSSNSMDKIIDQVALQAKKEKTTEVPPMPGFELKGRGLIYNCEQGYWACTTKEDYQKCQDLENWSQENKKEMKCQTSAVYESNGDCTIMQIHYINTLEAQKLCKLNP